MKKMEDYNKCTRGKRDCWTGSEMYQARERPGVALPGEMIRSFSREVEDATTNDSGGLHIKLAVEFKEDF